MSDTELLDLASGELVSLGLAKAEDVEDGVIRQAKAYPVYDHEYRKHLAVIQNFLATIDNLQTTGQWHAPIYQRITQCWQGWQPETY